MNVPLRKSAALLLTLLAPLIAASCYSASYHMAPLPDQSVELTSPDLCRIYVLRPSVGPWNLRRVIVFDGEKEIGSINDMEYVCWERRPGPSRLTIVYAGPEGQGGYGYTLFDVETEAGGVYFYGVTLEPGSNEPDVNAIEPAEARLSLERRAPAQTLGSSVDGDDR